MSEHSMIDELIANDPEVLESFIDEARTCLIEAEKDLSYLLEQSPDHDKMRLERAARSVHTMKGAAGFLGLDEVAQVALCMEKMLKSVMAGAITADGNDFDLLLKCLALLSRMLTDIKGSHTIDTEPLLALLNERMPSIHVK